MQVRKNFYKKVTIFLVVIACIFCKNEVVLAQQRARQQQRSVRPVARTPQRSSAVASRSQRPQFLQSFYPIGLSLEQYEQLSFEQVGYLEDLYHNDRDEYNKEIQKIIRSSRAVQRQKFIPVAEQMGLFTARKPSVLYQEELQELAPLIERPAKRRMPMLQPVVQVKESVSPNIQKEEAIQAQAQMQELQELVIIDPFKEVLGKYSSGFFSSASSVFVYLKKGLQRDLEQIKKGEFSLSFGSSSDFLKAVEFLQAKTKNLQPLNLDQYLYSLGSFLKNYKNLLDLCQEYAQTYVKSFLQKPRAEALQQKAQKELEIFFAQCDVLIEQYNQFIQSCCLSQGASLFKSFVQDTKGYLKKELSKINVEPRVLVFVDNADAAFLAEKYSHLFYVCDLFQALFVKDNLDLDQMREFIQKSFQPIPVSLYAYENQKAIIMALREVVDSLYKKLIEAEKLFDRSEFEDPYFVFSLFKEYVSIESKMSDISKESFNPELKSFFMRFMRSFADHLANRVRKLDDDAYLVPFKAILNDLDQIAKGDSSLKESFLKKHQESVLALSAFSMLCYGAKNVIEMRSSRSFNKDKAYNFCTRMKIFAKIPDLSWKEGAESVFDSVHEYIKKDETGGRTKSLDEKKVESIARIYIASYYFATFFAQSKVPPLNQSFETFFGKGGSYFDELCEQLTDIQMPKMMFALLPIYRSLVDKIEYSSLKDEVKNDWKFFYTQVVAFHDALKNKTCYTSVPGHTIVAYKGSSGEDDLFNKAYGALSPLSIQTCIEGKFLKASQNSRVITKVKTNIVNIIKDLYLFAQALYKNPKREDEVAIALEAMQLLSQIYVEFSMAVAK